MMKKTISVSEGFDPAEEKRFWIEKTPLERLEAVELMRQIVYGYVPTSDRLQRIFTVVEHPQRIAEVVDGVAINFINLENLKTNKLSAGRHKDLDDLEKPPLISPNHGSLLSDTPLEKIRHKRQGCVRIACKQTRNLLPIASSDFRSILC